jgi:U3 small nucleolar RNA-associated protein 13
MKTNYQRDKRESIYTGSTMYYDKDLYTICQDTIIQTNIHNYSITKTEYPESILCFAMDSYHRIVSLQNNQVWIHDKQLKFASPCLVLCLRKRYVAMGFADSSIVVYDLQQGYMTHQFKGHGGIITCLDLASPFLVSGSADTTIRVWDLVSKKCIHVLDFHVGVVRQVQWVEHGMVSVGRDGFLVLWNEGEPVFTHQVKESLEAMVVVGDTIVTGGEAGILRFWSMEGALLEEHTVCHGDAISFLGYKELLYLATTDQNMLWMDMETKTIQKQIAGYNEEILDLQVIQNEYIAVVSNTNQLRVYSMDWDCTISYCHDDTILCVDVMEDWVLTGSKDHTAKLWKCDMSETDRQNRFQLMGVYKGHTGHVTCCRFSQQGVLTGSTDRTIKYWSLDQFDSSVFTFLAHEKDITSIDVAPNQRWFATSSLDKTSKLWKIQDGSLQTTLKGHKRGIWKVRFSPVDQVVATCSTDKTIKLWNLEGQNIKTLQGHFNTVLNIQFVEMGMQLLSTGSDGLLKLWTLQSGECVTFEGHEDRVWGLAVAKDAQWIVTGSTDSSLCLWWDRTAQDLEQEQEQEEQRVLGYVCLTRLQNVTLYRRRGAYKDALILTMTLNLKQTMVGLLEEIRGKKQGISGDVDVDHWILGLDVESVFLIDIGHTTMDLDS